MGPVIPFHHKLMSSGHEGETITVVEGLGDVLTEGVSSSSGGDSPSAPVIWVRPEEVTHGALVRHLLQPVQGPDVVQGVDAGREAAVQTEDLAVHQRREGKVIKQVGEIFPHVGVSIFPQALIIETIDLGDLTALMVAAKNGDATTESHLECDKERDSLDAVVSSVNIVPHEQVISIWRLATDLEELHEVVELAVDVTTHRHRTLDALHVALLAQDLLGLLTQNLDLVLGQLLALHQLLDPCV